MRLVNCSKKYEENLVFEKLNMEFLKGIYWLIGENGIGKSVFLRCLTQIESFTSGKIINNTKDILFLPEFSIVEDWLSIRENIKLLFYFHKINISEEIIDKIIGKLNISLSNTLSSNASVGTNMKVSLSLLFTEKKWDLIIIDETLAHIDIDSQVIIFDNLIKRAKSGSIIIFTYHGELPNNIDIDIIKKIKIEKERIVIL